MAALNWSRASAFSITAALAPIISTPYFSSTPCWCNSIARFKPVWPPRVGSMASGRSASITLATISQVSGSMYVRSAISGSVMIVAGLELTNTTSYPSSRRRLARLGAGVVELAGLPDNDRPGADQQDFLDVVAAWHGMGFPRLIGGRVLCKIP